MPFSIFSVTQLNSYIKEKLDYDRLLRNIWVKGEISNFKHHSSGHMYFTLKDKQSVLKAVMFKSYSSSVPFNIENGLSVLARGNISLFLRDGQYQLYVEELHPEGYGATSLAFEQLKRKLTDEGLFDTSVKKAIPVLPRKIGIVSSPTGAAIRDILTVVFRRFPQMQVVIAPTQVQGELAPKQIVQAIKNLNQISNIDVIIVSRGGGSIEELGAFNTEEVARAIFASHIPIVSGIGHETDFTIADFVADLRAATPSAAAELTVPLKSQLKHQLQQLEQRLYVSFKRQLQIKKQQLVNLELRSLHKNFNSQLNQRKQQIDQQEIKLVNAMNSRLNDNKAKVHLLAEKLNL
ncbi:MAG: exodeoxyribonuclease VII large subunit, partial [Bacillota bacterium]|nr:exodeoxyribonuclease VII large subunit [Bacillota bacterium]